MRQIAEQNKQNVNWWCQELLNVPQQENDNDCGVFALAFAECWLECYSYNLLHDALLWDKSKPSWSLSFFTHQCNHFIRAVSARCVQKKMPHFRRIVCLALITPLIKDHPCSLKFMLFHRTIFKDIENVMLKFADFRVLQIDRLII